MPMFATGTPVVPKPYTRPVDWPTVSIPAAHAISILAAVFPAGGNYAALNVTVTGGYTVNWGDGTSANYATGVTAEHQYTYSTLSTSVTSRGYKTAIIHITTQTGGAAITAFDLSSKHSTFGAANAGSSPWLDVEINTPSATSIAFSTTVLPYYLEVCNINACGSLANLDYMWYNCFALQQLILPSGFGSAATSMDWAWNSCSALQQLVLPSGFGAAVTSLNHTWYNCPALELLTLPSGFGGSVTNLNFTWAFCSALAQLTLPAGFGAAATSAMYTWNSCFALQQLVLPSGFGSLITTLDNAWNSCSALQHLSMPSGFGAAVTSTANTWAYCSALQQLTFPTGFGASLATVDSAWNSCSALQQLTFPSGFGSAIASAFSTWDFCSALQSITNLAIPITFSVDNSNLDATALNAIYTALPTVTGQTLTCSSNYGYAGSTQTIATNKGWTLA
jgi:BspA type Leucine rich repeat region (6 copies)